MVTGYEQIARSGGLAALTQAGGFFMQDNPVRNSLIKITSRLHELNIDYAVVGGMALVAHGYERTTVDVDLLVTSDGLKRAHEALDGLGYVPPFVGSKHLRDTETGVRIEFLITGQFPGDGVPKPIAFPHPADAGVDIAGIRFLSLERLIELKLASGMTNPGRLKDLADVQELIRVRGLDAAFGERIDASVRDKFVEFVRAVRADSSET
ncbi:MAG: nucleotidyltransferase family protein [Burkholderiales bacterium]|nr:nucleotidyltransferase family protein [Phycisphaerae bacterium]